MTLIGITESNDAIFNKSWERWALEKRNPTILITKNIEELLKQYPTILSQQNIIIHATITGYGGTFIEPNVPKAKDLLQFLSAIKEKDRIVIRIDPIIPLKEFVVQSKNIYDKAEEIGFNRFRISSLDLYPHVVDRLQKYCSFLYELKQIYNWDMSHSLGEHKEYMIHANLNLRQNIFSFFPKAEICGEPGIKCDGCISRKDLQLFNIKPEKRYIKNDQRQFCNCLGIKKELCKHHECAHDCIYCYWNKK